MNPTEEKNISSDDKDFKSFKAIHYLKLGF